MRKFAIVFIVVVAAASILFISFFPKQADMDRSLPQSGWRTWQQHYDGASGAGTFLQASDGGFAIVGTSSSGELLLIRTDTDRQMVWNRTFGAGWGNAVSLSGGGGFVVAATKSGSSGLGNRSWLVITDSEGNLLISRTYNGTGFSRITNSSDGGFVFLSSFRVNGTEYPGLTKVNSAGGVQWTRIYSRGEAELFRLYSLVATSDGGYAAAGELRFTTYGVTYQNGWFLKTDANGEVQVNRPFSMEGWTVFRSVAQTTDGGYLIVGATANATGTPYSACIVRTDWDGHMLWSQINETLPGDNRGRGFELHSISENADGNFIIAGHLGQVGVTKFTIKDTGELLMAGSFGFSAEMLIQTVPGYIIGIFEGGDAWVGFNDGKIWLMEEYRYTE